MFKETFETPGLDDEVAISEFLKELPALQPEQEGPTEEESQRRSQRKKIEKFDPDDETFGPKKKRIKGSVNVSSEKSAAPEQNSTNTSDEQLLKKKRTDKDPEDNIERQTEKPQAKISNYEAIVAHLSFSSEEIENDEVILPFLRLAELWLRLLELFNRRMIEVRALNEEILRLLERVQTGEFAVKEGKGELESLMQHLRNWALKRCICTQKVLELHAVHDKLSRWTQEADIITCRQELRTFDELREFIKSGENLNIFLPSLEVLRSHLKRSKTWINKFQRINNGKNSNSAELEELAAESEQLLVNLDEYTSQMILDSKKYCICRQPYHSEMIGCDECDEWYHLQCVGLSQTQADRLERYLCIRCTLRQSFLNAATLAAQSVNKWMNPLDVMRSREQRLNKVSKRVMKEEKEMERIQSELSRLIQMGKQRHESEVARMGSDHPTAALFGAQPTSAEEAEQFSLLALLSQNNEITASIRKFTNEYEVLKQSFKRNQTEEKEVQAMIQLEQSRSSEISDWMESFKDIIWPSSSDTRILGAPLPTGELPVGVKKAAVEAERLGISKVEDVVYVLQCFLWMGWCFRCLISIRGPISTNELRRLVNASRSIKFYDDRIVKILVGVLTRAKYSSIYHRLHFHLCVAFGRLKFVSILGRISVMTSLKLLL